MSTQLFYAIYSLLCLGILARFAPPYGSIHLRLSSGYWLAALALLSVSSLMFAVTPWLSPSALTMANTLAACAPVMLAVLAAHLRRPAPRRTGYVFAAAALAWAVMFESIRQVGPSLYEWRVLVVTATATTGLMAFAWLAWPLARQHRSAQMGGAIVFSLLAGAGMLLRAWLTFSDEIVITSIYQESGTTAAIRYASTIAQFLMFLMVSNFFAESLTKIHEETAIKTEDAMLVCLNALAKARDDETGSHTIRTQLFVRSLASQLSKTGAAAISAEDVELMFKAAPLHDAGKVGIPDNILLKPGKLTPEEWEVMKKHAIIGEGVLAAAMTQFGNIDVLRVAKEIAGGHHEKWDGSGYPRGLAGEQIPLSARIMAVADIYDALTSTRPYKAPWSHADAVREIVSKKGSHLDPMVVEALESVQHAFEGIAASHLDA